jgi:ParB family chromosome partitioning protein
MLYRPEVMAESGFLDTFAELSAALGAAADTVLSLPLDLIDEDPANPRQAFDPDELAALAETLKSRGLKQPIVVRPANEAGRYVIRFGARRFRAARLAGLTEIRAVVEAGDLDEADALTDQLIENEQRAPLSTADMAQAVARLLALGKSQAEIARRLGRGKDLIAIYAAVPQMPAELRALAEGLGARTLYELWGAWKADPRRTQGWLAGRKPAQITQAAARAFAATLKPSRQPTSRSSEPKAARPTASRDAVAEDPVVAVPSPAAGAATRQAVVRVQVGRRQGRLVLDRPSSAHGIWVEIDGEAERVPAATVKLLAVTLDG